MEAHIISMYTADCKQLVFSMSLLKKYWVNSTVLKHIATAMMKSAESHLRDNDEIFLPSVTYEFPRVTFFSCIELNYYYLTLTAINVPNLRSFVHLYQIEG